MRSSITPVAVMRVTRVSRLIVTLLYGRLRGLLARRQRGRRAGFLRWLQGTAEISVLPQAAWRRRQVRQLVARSLRGNVGHDRFHAAVSKYSQCRPAILPGSYPQLFIEFRLGQNLPTIDRNDLVLRAQSRLAERAAGVNIGERQTVAVFA